MDPITARMLSQVFGIGAAAPVNDPYGPGGMDGPVAQEPGGAGFEYDDTPVNVPSNVAPTGKSEKRMRTSFSMNQMFKRGGGLAGAPMPPQGFDPNIITTLMGQAPSLAQPMTNQINQMYDPLQQRIQQSGTVAEGDLPYVPPDPMADPMRAAASMGLGRWGAALQGMPERGGEAAARVERGIGAHQQGMANVQEAKLQAKKKSEEMGIAAESNKISDTLRAQDTAFKTSVDTYLQGKDYDKDLYGIVMGAWDNAEQRKVAMRIAQLQNSQDSAERTQADMLINARSAISYASAEVAKQLINHVAPEDMDITFPVPGAPGDPMKGVPPGYQSVHGVSQLDQRIIGSLQSISDKPSRDDMIMMYTNAISTPVYQSTTKRAKDLATKAETDKILREEVMNATLSGTPFVPGSFGKPGKGILSRPASKLGKQVKKGLREAGAGAKAGFEAAVE